MFPPDGPGQARFRESDHPSPFVATHAKVSLNRTVEKIQAIPENHVMLELMTPEMLAAYKAAAPRKPPVAAD